MSKVTPIFKSPTSEPISNLLLGSERATLAAAITKSHQSSLYADQMRKGFKASKAILEKAKESYEVANRAVSDAKSEQASYVAEAALSQEPTASFPTLRDARVREIECADVLAASVAATSDWKRKMGEAESVFIADTAKVTKAAKAVIALEAPRLMAAAESAQKSLNHHLVELRTVHELCATHGFPDPSMKAVTDFLHCKDFQEDLTAQSKWKHAFDELQLAATAIVPTFE